ncbi:MAG TPA: Holliday junction resolvase RuvX [Chloroflexota bacterium]|nr:Holliday junction resolvase RuvX [Chloroflexota bacterium]
MPRGRTLALDVGERRIGLAISDEEGMLATPLGVLERRSFAEDVARLATIVREQRAERLVVGLPRTLAGEIGPQARRVLRWAERMGRALGLPLEYWDERFSTLEAAERLAHRRPRRRPPLDAAAAAVILQDYLDHHP